MVAGLGSWRGRAPDKDEWDILTACVCPACQHYGLDGLKGSGIGGFCSRATHNLWVLLNEANEIQTRLEAGTYGSWYVDHLDKMLLANPPLRVSDASNCVWSRVAATCQEGSIEVRQQHLDNSIYRSLVQQAFALRERNVETAVLHPEIERTSA